MIHVYHVRIQKLYPSEKASSKISIYSKYLQITYTQRSTHTECFFLHLGHVSRALYT